LLPLPRQAAQASLVPPLRRISGFRLIKLKNSCAEFYVTAKTGERMELFVDPATGTIIGGQ
jgi:hypothetical protein